MDIIAIASLPAHSELKSFVLKVFSMSLKFSVCWADSTHFTVYSLSRRCNVAQRKKKKMLRLSMSLNPSVHWTQTTEHLPRFLRLSRYLFVLICLIQYIKIDQEI